MWRCTPSHGHQMIGQVHDYLEDIQPGLSRKVVGGVVVTSALTYVAVRGYRYYHARQVGQERGMAARQACRDLQNYLDRRQAEEGPVNKGKEASIVKLGLKDLKEKLSKGELKAVEVLRAFQRKALAVNNQLNCITEPVLEAEAMAKELDKLKPEQRGPLHGVPFSVKESIIMKGHDCNAGFSSFVGKLAKSDADIIQLLKSLGAIPFVRTNCPQGLMSFSCSNPIYGRTCNPHNKLRGPGGSSGGEGALLAAGGSVIGIGSDFGGSLRIPANMCGVYSLKPTVDRFLNKGHIVLKRGQIAVRPTNGPVARDMDSLIHLTREIFTAKMHDVDPFVPPFGFRDELFEKKGVLRIGFFTSMEELPLHPACLRAVMEAKAALEGKGHEVVPFEVPTAYAGFCNLWTRAIFADERKEFDQFTKDEVLDTCIASMYYIGKLPLPLKYILSKLMAFLDPPGSQMSQALCRLPRTVVDWWNLQENVQVFRSEFGQAWKSQKLDALLCPAMPFPAITAGLEETVLCGIAYTCLFNLLDYPAGCFPVSAVTEQDLQHLRDPSVYPQSGLFQKFVVKDSEGSVGLPVGIQCVSLPFQEEMVLRIMKEVDSVVRK